MQPEYSLPAILLVAFVIAQRLLELGLSRRNTARLLARGGREVGAGHYPVIVALHTAWIACLAVFGWQSPLIVVWVAIFAVLQIFRVWILASLGPRWTTRIIVIDEPLIRRGPYRVLSHPNYILVAAEIIAVPMALGLTWVAALFTILNAIVLYHRISMENEALSDASAGV